MNRKSSGGGLGTSVQQGGWGQVAKWFLRLLNPSGSPQITEIKRQIPGYLQLAQTYSRMRGFLEGQRPWLAAQRAPFLTCKVRMAGLPQRAGVRTNEKMSF